MCRLGSPQILYLPGGWQVRVTTDLALRRGWQGRVSQKLSLPDSRQVKVTTDTFPTWCMVAGMVGSPPILSLPDGWQVKITTNDVPTW